MSELGWQRFVRRDDPSDVYEARRVGHGYVLRRPGEEEAHIRMPKESFRSIYEPEEIWHEDELDHDEVLGALERALEDNPHLRDQPAEEVARQLVLGGYVEGEPSPSDVAAAMATVVAEEQAFGPDVPLEES